MKKIFISIPRFLPAYKAGGPVQSIANMVNEMKEGYSFYIFCGNRDLNGQRLDIKATDEWLPYNDYTKVWYASRNNRSQQMVTQLEKIKPDVIYMVGLFSWHFNMVPLFFSKAPLKILSVKGMLHPGALGQKALKKKIYLQWLRWLKINKRCRFHASDLAEADFIKNNLGKDASISIASNFPRVFEAHTPLLKTNGELTITSIGLISPMKNYALVLDALMQVKVRVHYNIYGPVKEADYWKLCLQKIQGLPENISVQYHRELPPALIGLKLQHSHVFILPSESENFGHAIYEALSAGLPVITSHNTPWNGLEEARAGMNVSTSPKVIAAAIEVFAAMNPDELNNWSAAAVNYAKQKLDINKVRADHTALFELKN